MGTIITPTYIQNFETNLTFKITNAWRRTNSRLYWPRLMNITPVSGALEYIEWMLETARIQPSGPKGANLAYDPLVAISDTLRHGHFGNGLDLYRPDIEDDKIARAPVWANGTGEAQAYWPQRVLIRLMQTGKLGVVDGKPNVAYDGGVFFRDDHPVNPFDTSQGTYSNLHIGTAFTAENLARVTAYIETIRHPGDAPMGALPTITAFPSNFRLRANQALNAEIYTDILNTLQGAAASNTIKTAYEFEPPIISAELASEPTVWYIGIPADQDAYDSPFVYVQREPYYVNSYSPMDQVTLARQNKFEWQNKGRNGAAYGHPYRFHRCEASGSQPSYLTDLTI